MKSVLALTAAFASALALSGCAAPCVGCGNEVGQYGVAFTRPAVCNDYPVSYRVQTPETDNRIRPVDRPQIVSDGGTSYPAATACCR